VVEVQFTWYWLVAAFVLFTTGYLTLLWMARGGPERFAVSAAAIAFVAGAFVSALSVTRDPLFVIGFGTLFGGVLAATQLLAARHARGAQHQLRSRRDETESA
jgi:hypothetical protein